MSANNIKKIFFINIATKSIYLCIIKLLTLKINFMCLNKLCLLDSIKYNF